MSVAVTDVPLRAILDSLAGQIGLRIAYGGSLDERVTVRLEDLPVSEALRQLLRGHSYLLHLEAGSAGVASFGWLWVAPATTVASGGVESEPPARASPAPRRAARGLLFADRERTAEEAQQELATAMADPDPRIRRAALYGIAELEAEAAAALLRQALLDAEPSVRRAAVRELGASGSRDTVGALTAALHDRDSAVRLAAVDTLGGLPAAASATALASALADADARVREAAAEHLALMHRLP
jgi:HEAT repeat protein